MKFLAAVLLLATLVSCAGPTPEPADEVAVMEQGICRASRNGAPVLAERGIGGTGAPARTQYSDRGIGGTGIVGVVTGFASICVDGLEVRFDKNAAVSINGSAATTKQLRVGQLVVIKASGLVTAPDSVAQAQMISVRYEVSGPIEAVDTGSGAMMVAGQRVTVLPSTWMAARFVLGNWITVSGLRKSDGTIVASRLDRARTGALAVRGQLTREHNTTRIGSLVLHGLAVETVKVGMYVSIAGRYNDGAAEVTALDADLLSQDPASYFGISTQHLIVQAFVHVEYGMVWLNNGQRFKAGPAVQGKGSAYRNGILWLERTADGSFAATGLHYTNFRAQPMDAPSRSGGHGADDLVLPPDVPPEPPTDAPPAGATDSESGTNDATVAAPGPPPSDVPTSSATPSLAEPSGDGAFIADQGFTLPLSAIATLKIAAATPRLTL
jgi:hypothetical protein